MPVADLLAIAGLPMEHDPLRRHPWGAAQEIGGLVAAATFLTAEQVEQLTALARELKAQNIAETQPDTLPSTRSHVDRQVPEAM